MLNGAGLTDELRMLKGEVSRLLNAKGTDSGSGSRADVLADQIKAALNELSETLHEQRDHAEKLISDRPTTTLASALTLGVVIGFMMRRH
jgi:ElaB/YqjD/DUF883 family membrane-anchored ribosome-binding protein